VKRPQASIITKLGGKVENESALSGFHRLIDSFGCGNSEDVARPRESPGVF